MMLSTDNLKEVRKKTKIQKGEPSISLQTEFCLNQKGMSKHLPNLKHQALEYHEQFH